MTPNGEALRHGKGLGLPGLDGSMSLAQVSEAVVLWQALEWMRRKMPLYHLHCSHIKLCDEALMHIKQSGSYCCDE